MAAVCVSCGTIQPPHPTPDLFSLLSLPRSFFIEEEEINKAHRELSRQVHPDRFTHKSAVERRMSLQWTASVNEARRVLKEPLLRARYLATGEVRPKEVGGPQMPAEFLELIFELQLEQADEPEQAAQKAVELYREEMFRLESCFVAWEKVKEQDTVEGVGSGLEQVELILAKLKYLGNIVEAH